MFEDVSAAIDHLADIEQVDASRAVTCGHSAGGHLALWLAARHRLAGGVGAEPRVRPVAAVSQAGVADLERGWRENLGDGAVEGLLGPLSEGSELFAAASPAALAPLGVPQLLVHGTEDDVVPISQSRAYAEREPLAELVELEGADHFDILELDHPGWQTVIDWLPAQLG
jgi:pimeloyl-ACP methyl ester carboxylesterase